MSRGPRSAGRVRQSFPTEAVVTNIGPQVAAEFAQSSMLGGMAHVVAQFAAPHQIDLETRVHRDAFAAAMREQGVAVFAPPGVDDWEVRGKPGERGYRQFEAFGSVRDWGRAVLHGREEGAFHGPSGIQDPYLYDPEQEGYPFMLDRKPDRFVPFAVSAADVDARRTFALNNSYFPAWRGSDAESAGAIGMWRIPPARSGRATVPAAVRLDASQLGARGGRPMTESGGMLRTISRQLAQTPSLSPEFLTLRGVGDVPTEESLSPSMKSMVGFGASRGPGITIANPNMLRAMVGHQMFGGAQHGGYRYTSPTPEGVTRLVTTHNALVEKTAPLFPHGIAMIKPGDVSTHEGAEQAAMAVLHMRSLIKMKRWKYDDYDPPGVGTADIPKSRDVRRVLGDSTPAEELAQTTVQPRESTKHPEYNPKFAGVNQDDIDADVVRQTINVVQANTDRLSALQAEDDRAARVQARKDRLQEALDAKEKAKAEGSTDFAGPVREVSVDWRPFEQPEVAEESKSAEEIPGLKEANARRSPEYKRALLQAARNRLHGGGVTGIIPAHLPEGAVVSALGGKTTPEVEKAPEPTPPPTTAKKAETPKVVKPKYTKKHLRARKAMAETVAENLRQTFPLYTHPTQGAGGSIEVEQRKDGAHHVVVRAPDPNVHPDAAASFVSLVQKNTQFASMVQSVADAKGKEFPDLVTVDASPLAASGTPKKR